MEPGDRSEGGPVQPCWDLPKMSKLGYIFPWATQKIGLYYLILMVDPVDRKFEVPAMAIDQILMMFSFKLSFVSFLDVEVKPCFRRPRPDDGWRWFSLRHAAGRFINMFPRNHPKCISIIPIIYQLYTIHGAFPVVNRVFENCVNRCELGKRWWTWTNQLGPDLQAWRQSCKDMFGPASHRTWKVSLYKFGPH